MPITYPAAERIDADPRGYYGGYLERLRGVPDQPVWGGGPQQVAFTPEQQASGVLWGLGGVGAWAASGFIPLSGGGRVWDYYLKGIRALEEYSPGQVMRTFQLSNLLAPLETAARTPFTIAPEAMQAMAGKYQGQAYLNYLSTLTGRSILDPTIMDQGLTFAGGQLRTAATGEVLLARAATIPAVGSTRFMESYARSLGAGVVGGMFHPGEVPFGGRVIIGGAGGMQAAGRMAGGIGTELVERFHRLLKSPFEMEPFKSTVGWLEKPRGFWPGLRLGVESGKGLQTFGRIALKLGVYGPLAYAGYQYLDYATRNTELLDSTIFGEGITAGVATAWAKTNLAWHHVADATGLQAYGRWQEEVAPGSTDLSRLLGFPLMGVMGGVAAQYSRRVWRQARLQIAGREIIGGGTEKFASAAAAGEVAEQMLSFGEKGVGTGWFSKLGRRWAEKGAIWGIGKAGPTKLAALVGAAAGAALTLPFIPGALAPELTAEELEDLYTGKREVPVRAGQFWEFGRQPWTGGKVQFFTPHWYRRLLDRPREKGLWGALEEERGGEIPPHEKWWIKEFTYGLEKAHYRDRPFPVTGTALEDVPFVGPALAGTIGRLIKPPLSMHSEEWLRGGGLDRGGEGSGAAASREALAAWNEGEALHLPRGFGERRELEIGEMPPGMPVSPYGLQGLAGDQWYRLCFSGEAKVRMTDRSYKEISNVEIGDYVWSYGGPKKVMNKFVHERAPEEQLLEVRVGGAFRSFRATPNHEVLALKTDYCTARGTKCSFALRKGKHYSKCKQKSCDTLEPQWMPLGTLEQGDFLIEILPPVTGRQHIDLLNYLPPKVYMEKEGNLYRRVPKKVIRTRTYYKGGVPRNVTHTFDAYQNTTSKVPVRIVLSKELGWLFGYFLAEGYVDTRRVTFGAHEAEEGTCVKKAINILRRVFGIEKYRIDRKVKAGEITKGIELVISSTVLADVFKALSSSGGRKLLRSDLVWSNEEFLLGVLGGFIDGDGHQRQNEISLVQSDRTALKQIQDICSLLGVCPGAGYQKAAAYKGGEIKHTRYTLTLHRGNLHVLLSKGLESIKIKEWVLEHYEEASNTSRIPVRVLNGLIYIFKPIRSVELLGFSKENLYDLSVEEDHFYTVEDCVVHNSEMVGLPGFIFTALKEKMTGTPDLFDQLTQLESSRRMFGAESQYWNWTGLQVGGGIGTTEIWRRLYPHRRRQIDLSNSIRNTMPASWLPGPGERSPNFLYGDPYLAVPMGEYRLPGPGYAARYPELEGVDPANYPLAHRYRILQDVAPYSTQAKAVKKEMSIARNAGLLTEEEEAMYQEVQRQGKEKRERREFHEYKYRDREYTLEREKLIEAAGEDKPGIIGRMLGTYWEEMSHRAETPLEYLTPIAPAHKLIHMRSAIEDYAAMQVHGGEAAFWQHPWTHFWRPFLTTSAAAVGADDVPDHIKAKREVQDYFDALKYLKHLRLERIARAHGDTEAAMEFARVQRETLTGLNPYGYNFQAIFRALPRSDKDYFNSFVKADLNEREEIEKLIPENQRALYEARWEMADTEDRKKAIKAGLLSSREEEQAREEINRTYTKAGTEGFPTSRELWAEYLATRLRGESYADWYRRVYLMAEKLQGRAVPGPDWVGWHPSVDLEDIRLKVVEALGQDLHDHDLWPSRRTQMAHRPYINDEAVRAITDEDERLSKEEVGRRVKDLLSSLDIPDAFVSVTSAHPAAELDRIDMHFQEDRLEEAREMLRREGMAH